MDTTPGPIKALTAHLAVRSQGKEGRMAMSRFSDAGIDIETALDPLELARSCHDSGRFDRSRTVVSGLVALSVTDELAGLAALVALRPGLFRIVRRLVVRGASREDAETDVVATAWEAMGSVARKGSHPRAAQQVISTTWERCRTAARRPSSGLSTSERSAAGHSACGRSRGCRVPALLDGFDAEAIDANPADRVSTTLWEARRGGLVSARQATLIHDTRVLDISIAAAAAKQGRTAVAVRKERERVEAKLRAVVDDPKGDREGAAAGLSQSEVVR
jgi:DNA-directed RNA polymerase specialized sigma24 family protein